MRSIGVAGFKLKRCYQAAIQASGAEKSERGGAIAWAIAGNAVYLFVFSLRVGQIKGDNNRGFRFVYKPGARIHRASSRCIQFTFTRADQRQAGANILDGVVRKWVAVSGAGEGIFCNVGENALHYSQDARFLVVFGFFSHVRSR